MKPTVIASSAAGGGGPPTGKAATSNGINIPINHEYNAHPHHYQHPSQQQQPQQQPAYGSPGSYARQQQPQPQQQQQMPTHFQQGFGFEPDMDMDMDMFPRTRLGRMHDPFAGFDSTHFGFPQFGSMGRRRVPTDHMDDDNDFFNRLPSEFRHYIPDNFRHRRGGSGSGSMPSAQQQQQQPQHTTQPHQQQQYYQNYVPSGNTPPVNAGMMPPQSPSKKLCDAAIQTEDPTVGGPYDEVDNAATQPPTHTDNLNQHGLRNTVDMGVKSALESEQVGQRAHSAPPNEQQQQQLPLNGKRPVSPTKTQQGSQQQFGTQTSAPQFQKSYYAPQQQSHPQQKQQTPPPSQQQPQTPGGTYVRTIPIFVEGRSEPIINSHKEIPNQNKPYTPQQQQQNYQQQHHPQQQQQHRPTPLNTQQQSERGGGNTGGVGAGAGLPPQTPHTLDSINKIQDIQRDVLELMSSVEKFKGTRKDKEYVYLDEMLTRNLLKLDTIDTNGKDSIRLARKEAIKCIQASINVLEAKAEENAKTAQQPAAAGDTQQAAATVDENDNEKQSSDSTAKSSSKGDVTKETANADVSAGSSAANQEAIPLPPPEQSAVRKSLSQSSNKESQASQHDESLANDVNTTGESNIEASNNAATAEAK